ncbi:MULTISPECIES: hypothetical protein [Acetobacter]|uniref:hypothetical protein n=1 Tax=Acetobacter TaxID=434 RepID=UPI001878F9C5|nr:MULTISPECIES: hypothetical protein [Acetobacter]
MQKGREDGTPTRYDSGQGAARSRRPGRQRDTITQWSRPSAGQSGPASGPSGRTGFRQR